MGNKSVVVAVINELVERGKAPAETAKALPGRQL